MSDKASISVVLGTYNRLPYLKAAIDSVRASTFAETVEIIVVDGGSTDGTLDWLVRQTDVIAIIQHNRTMVDGKLRRKRSWGYFMNLAFKAAEADLICMISDDSVVHPDTLSEGVARYRSAVAEGQKIGGVAFHWRSWPAEQNYRVGLTFSDKMFVNHGILVKEALASVGYLDEKTYSFYCADGDVGLRMWQAGFKIIDAPGAIVEHFEDVSPDIRKDNYALVEQDWAAYLKRWDGIFVDVANPNPGQWVRSETPVREAAHLFPPQRPVSS